MRILVHHFSPLSSNMLFLELCFYFYARTTSSAQYLNYEHFDKSSMFLLLVLLAVSLCLQVELCSSNRVWHPTD